MATADVLPGYLDLMEAAQRLGIHPQSLRRLLKREALPYEYFAGKIVIDAGEVELFAQSYTGTPGRTLHNGRWSRLIAQALLRRYPDRMARSGAYTELAREFGVSRAAVWQIAQRLRFEVEQ